MSSNQERNKNPFLKKSSYNKNNKESFYNKRKEDSKKIYKKQEKEIDLSVQAFPSLDKKISSENKKIDLLDYSKVKTNIQESSIISKTNMIKPGWQIIYRENNKIVKKSGPSTIKNNMPTKTIEENTMETYRLLSNHWNNYRDELNNLLGEQSEYWNYKNQINEIYKEEVSILNQIDENKNSNISDDEEDLYNEVTDNYDFY